MHILSRLFGPPISQLEPLAVQAKLETTPPPYLLDVREPDEYREGHIAGANLRPLGTLGQHLQELPHDRQIICVCHSGSRSHAAARQLNAAGYAAVNLRGGMAGWIHSGLPFKKGNHK